MSRSGASSLPAQDGFAYKTPKPPSCCKCPSRPMSKAEISFFLQDTIKSAYTSFPDSSCCELKVRGHDIRGIATSMLMWKNCSVPTMLRAAC
ncbi:hypothetical protein E2C01_060215 [Portunus trituberculatus]|uniref:Uncharacterized protein n=1 Tax=Portunus trituberculatus TaxID=210409 RepID=A0A5B7H4M5_PORTR|nr:hypothetical protein [Portunus trituberculatus]